ncbi:hypothetical protein L3X38_014772 [Prunus dulcis]|uniref:KIB1-4 beta-propeller domain-containing protein n=1 Tax=Prunus dulcis TaxID=3755 RepID=A0AAD4WNU3_PRUDU|nr:hypothetical protein L3X38_014772 [Prunus dulcis]
MTKNSIIRLPPLNPPDECHRDACAKHCEYFVYKAAISADPISNANDCIVEDIAQIGDKSYVLTAIRRKLFIFEYTTQRILNVNAVAPLFFETDLYIKAYLVGSNEEELLLVHRYSTFTCQCRVTNGFRLFKMDDDKYTWIEKNDLGDFALFVGDNSSISVVASKIQGCESNCIYFYDDNDLTKRDRSFTDFGVYNIKSQRILKPARIMTLMKKLKQPPIWFLPSTYLTTAPPEKQCSASFPGLAQSSGSNPVIYIGYPGPITTRRRYAFSTATGLYGFDHLKTPKGFRRFVDDAIERSGELVAYISGMTSSAEIIRAMDEISNRVCSVIDSAELCRQTHPDREFVEEAIKASIRVNEYLHYLNTNHTLYNAVIKAEQEGNLLTDEAHRVAHYFRLDFERSGIHLSAEKVDRVNRLSIDISQLCRQLDCILSLEPHINSSHKQFEFFSSEAYLLWIFECLLWILLIKRFIAKEPVYPKHEIHICIPYGVSRINKNELKKKEKKKKNQEE